MISINKTSSATVYTCTDATSLIEREITITTNSSTSTVISDAQWTPTEIIDDLYAWYDASVLSSITESGGAVSQWDDLTTTGNNLTQGTGSDQPSSGTRTIGLLNTIDFDGNNDFLDFDTAFDMIGKHAFVALEVDDFDNNSNFITSNSGNVQYSLGTSSDNMRIWQSSNVWDGDTKSSVKPTVGSPGVYGWLADTDTKKYSVNGALQDTGDNYTSGSMTVDKMGEGSFSSACDVAVGEVIIAPSLSTANRQLIEGYLAWKWGAVSLLDAGHPYKSARPTK